MEQELPQVTIVSPEAGAGDRGNVRLDELDEILKATTQSK